MFRVCKLLKAYKKGNLPTRDRIQDRNEDFEVVQDDSTFSWGYRDLSSGTISKKCAKWKISILSILRPHPPSLFRSSGLDTTTQQSWNIFWTIQKCWKLHLFHRHQKLVFGSLFQNALIQRQIEIFPWNQSCLTFPTATAQTQSKHHSMRVWKGMNTPCLPFCALKLAMLVECPISPTFQKLVINSWCYATLEIYPCSKAIWGGVWYQNSIL